MVDEDSLVKRMMDNLIYYKEIEPFIVVTPNGRSTENCAREGSDYNSFMCWQRTAFGSDPVYGSALFDLCGGRRSKCFKNAQSDGGTFDGRDADD